MNEIQTVTKENALTVFTKQDGVEPYLSSIKEQALQEQTFRNDKLTLELEKFDAQLQMLARFVKV